MASRASQGFLSSIFDIAIERCGREFAHELESLRRERERLLSDSWRDQPPEDLPPAEQEEVFREIDFDTVVIHAAGYLDQKDYLAFLYEIAEVAIGSGEFEKANRLLGLIATRYFRSAERPLLAKTHQRIGDVAFYQNDLQTAMKEYRNSLALYDRLGDNGGIASIKNSMASLAVEKGDLSEAESLFKESKELADRENLVPLIVKIDCNLGNLYLMHAAWEEATASYTNALSKQPDKRTQARIHHDLAILHKWKKDYATANEHLQKSIELSADADDLYMKGLSYLEKAEITCREGDLSSATALATTAFQIFSELGDRLSVADVYKIFGIINRSSKRYDVAISYFENSLRINKDYDNPLNLGETLHELGELYLEQGEVEKAAEKFKSAGSYFNKIQAKAKIEETERVLRSIGA